MNILKLLYKLYCFIKLVYYMIEYASLAFYWVIDIWSWIVSGIGDLLEKFSEWLEDF